MLIPPNDIKHLYVKVIVLYKYIFADLIFVVNVQIDLWSNLVHVFEQKKNSISYHR